MARRYVHISGSVGLTGSGQDEGEGRIWADAKFTLIGGKHTFADVGTLEVTGKNRKEAEQKIRRGAKALWNIDVEERTSRFGIIVKRRHVLGSGYSNNPLHEFRFGSKDIEVQRRDMEYAKIAAEIDERQAKEKAEKAARDKRLNDNIRAIKRMEKKGYFN